jgi:probable phosphoglycerate mutase
MLVAFVRHAQALSNVLKILSDDYDQYPLTEEGIRQAEKVVEELRKLEPQVIFTSPVLRARQTAEIIGNKLGLQPILDERLSERGLGELKGKKVDENSEHWKLRLMRGLGEVKGLESWESMQARMLGFIDEVKARGFSRVVAVSHYDPIRSVIGYVCGLSDFQSWGIMVPNASITLLEVEAGLKVLGVGLPVLPNEVVKLLREEVNA